jgi:hypothetical protein
MHFTIACAVAADAPDALVTACGFTHTQRRRLFF